MWSRLQICNEIRLCVAKIKHRSIQLQIAPTNLLLWAVAFVNVRSNSSIRKIPVFWWIQIRFGASTLEITVYKLGMLGSGRKIKFGRGPWSVFVRKEADHGDRGSLSLENTHAHKTKQNKNKRHKLIIMFAFLSEWIQKLYVCSKTKRLQKKYNN